MSRPRIIVALASVAAIVVGVILLVSDDSEDALVVEMTTDSFEPAVLQVQSGDTVTFRNVADAEKWPASDVHPTHQEYPGFDAQSSVLQGESWDFRFERTGQWTYHDHLRPEIKGTIVVD